jgi:hypothetical protein
MTNFWRQEGVPHKGWSLVDVIDIREEGQSEWDTPYETCMMCGNEKIRYVHVVYNREIREEFRVGCVCAERMTNDYVNPRQREKKLRNKTNRRNNWVKKNWRITRNGNFSLSFEGHPLLIFQDRKTLKYKVKIGETWGHKLFDTLEQAKIATFNGIEYYKNNEEW